MGGRSDLDYAKDPQTCKSVSGGRLILNGALVAFRRSTQKTVALLVTEAELYMAILCAQDMIYVLHVIQSLELKVKLSMVLKVDNQGTVDITNSWNIGGQTCHIDVGQCFLHELKEEGILLVKWILGSKNDSDMFTKNLDRPLFEKFALVYIGKDNTLPVLNREGVRVRYSVWERVCGGWTNLTIGFAK